MESELRAPCASRTSRFAWWHSAAWSRCPEASYSLASLCSAKPAGVPPNQTQHIFEAHTRPAKIVSCPACEQARHFWLR